MTSFLVSGTEFGDRSLVEFDIGEVSVGGTLNAVVSMDDYSVLRVMGAISASGSGVRVVGGAEEIGINVFEGGSITGTSIGIEGIGPFGGEIRNSGTISGSVAGIATSYRAGDWQINNFGLISSDAAIEIGASDIGAKVKIYNEGDIEGTRWGISCKTELYLDNLGTINSGDIAIVTLGTNDYVGNSGTITGLIDLENGNNTFNGSSGLQEWVRTGDGDDLIFGGNNSETLTSLGGTDSIAGGAGNDIISGGSGNDFLSGDAGKDRLTGGAGTDLLSGGSGRDRFVFKSGDGEDGVSDFSASGKNHDVLDLKFVAAIRNFADLKANHMAQDGADVIISGNTGDIITLYGVNLGQLDAGDFAF